MQSHSAHRSVPSRVLALGALAAGLQSCEVHTHEAHIPGPPAGPPVYRELEPNDSPAYPDFIGVVDPYTLLYVDGHVEAIGFDIVDHIEFLSASPAAYDFRVDALSAYGDVDVTIYDPIAGLVVAEYFFSGPYEVGRVIVHEPNRPFQIIIEAYGVDTEWSLELVGRPYGGLLRQAAGSRDDEGFEAPAGAQGSPIEAVVIQAEDFDA
ncbi:MAG: hypothetical protein R3F49_00530 [Planctomycetota bacterium]